MTRAPAFMIPLLLRRDRRGVVAVMFAISAMVIVLAVGGAIDIQRALIARQQLSAIATLTCQYAARPSVVQTAFGWNWSNASNPYWANVTAMMPNFLATQNVSSSWANTAYGQFLLTSTWGATVYYYAYIPTTTLKIVGIYTIPVLVTLTCFDHLGDPAQPVPSATTTLLVNESFENSSYVGPTNAFFISYASPPASTGNPSANSAAKLSGTSAVNPALSSFVGYAGTSGNEWYTTGYCLEVGDYGHVSGGGSNDGVPDGSRFAKLDCDNGSGTAGNSSISTRVYLNAGSYELRYFYISEYSDANYAPTYICGTSASDVSWATDTNYTGGHGAKTNQINVYLDAPVSGAPPYHLTSSGSQHLAGSNLIDSCVDAKYWTERSVLINVTSAGYYWLSFAADGANDAVGGLIDDIRLCQGTCAGSVQDNFPSPWLAANNNNVNKVLFEDTFDTPAYSNATTSYSNVYFNDDGNMANFDGTWGSSSGWTAQTSGTGWGLAPTNQLPVWFYQPPQGSQYIELGWGAGDTLISRPFMLVPGYYQVSYYYKSEIDFSDISGVYCGTTPAAANVNALSYSDNNNKLFLNGAYVGSAVMADTNTVGVFMSHAQLASTPQIGNALGTTTTYNNPDGSTSTTPTVPPNNISLTNYNAEQDNPLLDICAYATTAQLRTRNIFIQKPAYYWLTLSALGTTDSFGGLIDDVKLTALGSPYMSNPPSSYVTIPVPDPQPGATISYTGFSVTENSHY